MAKVSSSAISNETSNLQNNGVRSTSCVDDDDDDITEIPQDNKNMSNFRYIEYVYIRFVCSCFITWFIVTCVVLYER